MKECSQCHSDPVYCRGLCRKCYKRFCRSRTDRECTKCGGPGAEAKGLCHRCHEIERARQRGVQPSVRYECCTKCGGNPIHGRGLCQQCYSEDKRRKSGMIPHPFQGKYRSCIVCGSNRIMGFGLCGSCYKKQYRMRNPDKCKEEQRERHARRKFDSTAEELDRLRAIGCERCGMDNITSITSFGKSLHVHHKDGTGQTANPNNRRANLMVLCNPCHRKVHHETEKVAI